MFFLAIIKSLKFILLNMSVRNFIYWTLESTECILTWTVLNQIMEVDCHQLNVLLIYMLRLLQSRQYDVKLQHNTPLYN